MPVMVLDEPGNRPVCEFGRLFLGHGVIKVPFTAVTIRVVSADANQIQAKSRWGSVRHFRLLADGTRVLGARVKFRALSRLCVEATGKLRTEAWCPWRHAQRGARTADDEG